jgi:hypothetical protein
VAIGRTLLPFPAVPRPLALADASAAAFSRRFERRVKPASAPRR